MTSAVSVRDLTVSYLDRPVLWDIDLDIDAGKLWAIVGPNGAGKSTLIKAVLGLVPATSGTVSVLGSPMPGGRKKCAYVPQRSEVDWDFPITVLDVVLMGTYPELGWFRRPKPEHISLARECLEKVGMTAFERSQISQLSGGQQQRVFFARALAQQAPVMFLDEPFAGVDAATEASLLKLLQQLRDEGRTLLVVHHDLETVKETFDSAVLLSTRLVASGPVSESLSSENLAHAYQDRLQAVKQAAP